MTSSATFFSFSPFLNATAVTAKFFTFKIIAIILLLSSPVKAQEQLPFLSFSRFQTFRGNYVLLTEAGAPKEMKLQLSLKYEVWPSAHLYFGYSQKLFWNALDFASSFPVTEIDFHPMGFWEKRFLDSEIEYLHIGYEHESNGRHVPLWRAWDRAFAEVRTKSLSGNFDIRARGWLPLYQSTENNDIIDYLGYGEIEVCWRADELENFSVTTMARKGTTGGMRNSSLELSLLFKAFALLGLEEGSQSGWRCYLQIWTGVGERLLMYNVPTKSFRVGVSLL